MQNEVANVQSCEVDDVVVGAEEAGGGCRAEEVDAGELAALGVADVGALGVGLGLGVVLILGVVGLGAGVGVARGRQGGCVGVAARVEDAVDAAAGARPILT